jgi:glutamate dehydrogenase/leucine dehydrogenase
VAHQYVDPCCCFSAYFLQNEIEYEDAVKLVNKGVAMVLEGANMPSTNDAIAHFHKCNVVLAAAKACNAGGVAVSGLEMAQNACMTTWSSEQVDERLKVGAACHLYVTCWFYCQGADRSWTSTCGTALYRVWCCKGVQVCGGVHSAHGLLCNNI